MKRFFTSFNVQAVVLGLGLFLLPRLSWGQTTIASDGFENSLSIFTETAGTGTYYSGNSGTGDRVASSPFAAAGTYGYGISNASVTITSSSLNTSNYTGIQMTFRLASFSIASTGNGADGTDIVTVEVSPDGGTTYYSTVRVLGNTNAYWSYAAGTGNASTAYDGNTTTTDFAPTAGGSRTSDGYSTVTITALPATATLKIRITMLNNATAERWIIDDFKITGVAPCSTPDAISSLSATSGSTQSILSWTNGTCYDEMMVVAKASSAVSFTPTGDGTAYTANAVFGSGTDVGSSQYVIYKGTGTGVTTTALTNGTTYNFAVYTRKGTTWSTSVTTTSTPEAPSKKFDGGTSGTGTVWNTSTNWRPDGVPTTSDDVIIDNTYVTIPAASNLSSAMGAKTITFANNFNTANSIDIGNGGGTARILSFPSGWSITNNATSGIVNFQPQNTGGTADLSFSIAGNGTISVASGGSVVISLSISESTASGLTKNGAGDLTLSGTNTYTGLTTVSAGKLKLNKTGGTTLPATNNVTVSGGTLQISSNQTLNNLIVNGGNVTVDDGVTLTINGTLTLTSGKITLGTGNVVISSGGSISGGSLSSYIETTNTSTNTSGTLTMPVSAGVMKLFPIGSSLTYDPVELTPAAAGSFSAKVKNSFSNTVYNGLKAVAREWNIAISSGTPGATIISLTDGSATYTPTKPRIGHYTGSAWEELTATYASNKWTLTTGTSSFSPFGVGDEGGFIEPVLGVDMKTMKAYNTVLGNKIDWTTASESNLSHFNIERAENEHKIWATIGSVNGHGSTNIEQSYSFMDEKPANISYYRLRQVDFDGKESFSKVVSVISNNAAGKLKVYPTMANDELTVITESNDEQTYQIFDLLGKTIRTGLVVGQNELIISDLPAGTFILKVGNESVKFFKN